VIAWPSEAEVELWVGYRRHRAERLAHVDGPEVNTGAVTQRWREAPMSRRRRWIALLAFVVSACAPGDWSRDTGYRSGEVYWWKSGITREAFGRDSRQCRRESRDITDVDEEDEYNRCMQTRGYQVVPKGFIPPK
jgi:hypothetical protein